MRAIWGLVGVGLLAIPMSAAAEDLAIPIDGGINAGVIATENHVETVDVHTDGFVGKPTSLTQSAAQDAKGHTMISASWASPDRGSVEFQLDGATPAPGNAIFNSSRAADWQYTFVARKDGVFRLGYSLTGKGLGAGGYLLTINGVTFTPGVETPADGTTLTNSQDFPLVAGRTYSVSLRNLAGFSASDEAVSGYTSSATFTFEIVPPQAQELLSDLVHDVTELGLDESTLQNALSAAERGDTTTALSLLESFSDSIETQRGKALTDARTDALIAAAKGIIDSL